MKNRIFLFASIAALLCFSACQKEDVTVDENTLDDDLITITFTAEKADMDTKTSVVEGDDCASFLWSDEDISNLKLYKYTSETDSALVSSRTVKLSTDKNTITISTTVSSKGSYTFRGFIANTVENSKPCVAAEQSPSADNFDPNADVLISDKITVTAIALGNLAPSASTSKMTFHRPVVVNKMTLKNLMPGETINTVVVKSTNYKILTGPINGTNTSSGTAITLDYSSNPLTVDDNGQAQVYFISLPVEDAALTVTATTTDEATYTKSFADGKTIDFKKGYFTRFNVAFPNTISISSVDYVASTDLYTINYKVYPATGLKVNASADVDWITDIDNSTAGKVTFKATGQDFTQPGNLPEGKVILSLSGADSKTVRIGRANNPNGAQNYFSFIFDGKNWGCNLQITNSSNSYIHTYNSDYDNLAVLIDRSGLYQDNNRSYLYPANAYGYQGVKLSYDTTNNTYSDMGVRSKCLLTNITAIDIVVGREHDSSATDEYSFVETNLYAYSSSGWTPYAQGKVCEKVSDSDLISFGENFVETFRANDSNNGNVQPTYAYTLKNAEDCYSIGLTAQCYSGAIYVSRIEVVADGYIVVED